LDPYVAATCLFPISRYFKAALDRLVFQENQLMPVKSADCLAAGANLVPTVAYHCFGGKKEGRKLAMAGANSSGNAGMSFRFFAITSAVIIFLLKLKPHEKTFLVIEDNADNAVLVIIVSDGRAAIEYLSGIGNYSQREQHPLPCLVLLDLKMPGKSGLEVLEWKRNQPSLSTLPTLMLTSSSQERDIRQAYLLGANGYLLKPNRPDDMLSLAKAIKDYWLNRNLQVVD
jgi:CheY-like chemotaxis protein